MRKMTIAHLAILLSLIFILVGCSGNLPQNQRLQYLSDNWGVSQESARYKQTYDPDAGRTVKPVEHQDARTAEISREKYRQTYAEDVDPGDEVETDFTIESEAD